MPYAPAGFTVSRFVKPTFGGIRWLTVAPNGDVFAAISDQGKILMLRDTKGANFADLVTTFAAGFAHPHGLAFHDGALYVGDTRAIWQLPYHDGDTVLHGAP